MQYTDILAFWFDELEEKQWWVKDPELDQQIAKRFGKTHRAASLGECYEWRVSPEGRLAEIIVLDQFSRNIFRGQPESFAHDAQALTLAQEAIANNAPRALNKAQTAFLYMPFMHSESKRIHEIALGLFTDLGSSLDFEIRHKRIIDRFGRYPHRNDILGRVSTDEEIAFLKEADSSF